MKKGIFVVIMVMVFAMTGCDNTKKYEDLMKDYGTTYYNKYMKGVDGQQFAEISIEMLENANHVNQDGYDLKKLKKCEKTSKVILEINSDKTIKNYTYSLSCK